MSAAKEVISASNILTGEKDWFSCTEARCRATFKVFGDYLEHMNLKHPLATVSRYPCPVKLCNNSCNTPKEWANHIGARHPDFVDKRDVNFFDEYFLRT